MLCFMLQIVDCALSLQHISILVFFMANLWIYFRQKGFHREMSKEALIQEEPQPIHVTLKLESIQLKKILKVPFWFRTSLTRYLKEIKNYKITYLANFDPPNCKKKEKLFANCKECSYIFAKFIFCSFEDIGRVFLKAK